MNTEVTILIVEDDISLAEALKGLFEHEGYTVFCASNSTETLDILSKESVALVLLDIRLGRENGLDLLHQLKSLRPEMAIIVITANGAVETSVQAMRLGADNYIIKPVDPPKLLAFMDKALEVHALRRKIIRLENRK